MASEAHPAHLLLYKQIENKKPNAVIFTRLFEIMSVCVCFTLQSSLIQEVVQVKQSVSGCQVLDETLR